MAYPRQLPIASPGFCVLKQQQSRYNVDTTCIARQCSTSRIPSESMSELSFAELGLDPAVLEAVSAVGYETPSPIQAQAIPALLAGNHLLGVAQTGTAHHSPRRSRKVVRRQRTRRGILQKTRARQLTHRAPAAIRPHPKTSGGRLEAERE